MQTFRSLPLNGKEIIIIHFKYFLKFQTCSNIIFSFNFIRVADIYVRIILFTVNTNDIIQIAMYYVFIFRNKYSLIALYIITC